MSDAAIAEENAVLAVKQAVQALNETIAIATQGYGLEVEIVTIPIGTIDAPGLSTVIAKIRKRL